jgi:NodT family efflux transporter outer membrane factor (OMF) lipoprotein
MPKHSFQRLLALASTVLAAGCATVGPNFKPPAPPTGAAAAGYGMAGDPAASGLQLSPETRAAGPWWLALGSPELDATVRQALRDSPSVAEAAATLEKARQEAIAAEGARSPRVQASASGVRERFNFQALGLNTFGNFPNPTLNLYSVGPSVSYDLDLFGGLRREAERTRADAEAEARRADAAYLTLSGNVVLQAIRVASLRAQIAAVQSVADDDRRVLDLVRRAERAGGESPSAIAGGEAQLAEDESLGPPLERELYMARHQLALLVGKSPAEWAPPAFDLASFTAPAAVPVSLPSDLVRRRPDILAAEADLHAAVAAVGVAVADQYPNVRISANLTQSTTHPGDLFRYASTGWSIGPAITAPLLDGGRLKARRRAAEAEAQISLAKYQQTVLRAFVQVSDVLAALATDQRSIETLGRASTAAQTSARDAQTAYRLGGGSLLQVVDAQRTYSRSRRAYIQAQAQYYSDFAQLFTATAADWRTGG